RMQRRSDGMKSGDTKDGVGEILLPGERGIKLKQESLSRGTLQLSNETLNVLDNCMIYLVYHYRKRLKYFWLGSELWASSLTI
ncbi:MAG: hypothetical protein VX505_11100, partial [Chloroflexota bacterium]|nr:hypothetical protein [Chloroflexota bacterium]